MVPPHGQVIIIQTEQETRLSPSPAEPPHAADPCIQAADPPLKAGDPAEQQHTSQVSVRGLSTRPPALSSTDKASPPAEHDSCPVTQEGQRQMPGPSLSFARALIGMTDVQQAQQHACTGSGQQPRSMPLDRRRHAVSSNEHLGLVFHVDNGSADQDNTLRALTAIAQVGVCELAHLTGNAQQAHHMLCNTGVLQNCCTAVYVSTTMRWEACALLTSL